jgi:hypothetical protein
VRIEQAVLNDETGVAMGYVHLIRSPQRPGRSVDVATYECGFCDRTDSAVSFVSAVALLEAHLSVCDEIER